MARRTKEESKQTKEDIFSSALNLFYKRGYTKTSLSEIALDLGLTKGAIYWHFKSKEDLFFQLINNIDKKINAILEPLAYKSKTPDDLKTFLRQYIELVLNNNEINKYFTVLIYKIEWTGDVSTITQLLDKQSKELKEFFEYLLGKWKKKKIIDSSVNPQKAAFVLSSILDGFIFEHIRIAPDYRDLDLADYAIDHFYKGLGLKLNESNPRRIP